MSITATELKINLGKYLMLAETEDIYITRNGKVVAKLTNPYQDRVDIAKSLFHILDTGSLDCRKALSSEIRDYEDAVMVETAIRTEMNCIVTRNVNDYAKSPVKVCEPCMFLKLLEKGNKES